MKADKQDGKSVQDKKTELVKTLDLPTKVAINFGGGDKKRYINKYLDDVDNCALLSCN